MSDELLGVEGKLELYKITRYEVFDPWSGRERGVFASEADARIFMKRLAKKEEK